MLLLNKGLCMTILPCPYTACMEKRSAHSMSASLFLFSRQFCNDVCIFFCGVCGGVCGVYDDVYDDVYDVFCVFYVFFSNREERVLGSVSLYGYFFLLYGHFGHLLFCVCVFFVCDMTTYLITSTCSFGERWR